MAKQLLYTDDARKKLLAGAEKLAKAMHADKQTASVRSQPSRETSPAPPCSSQKALLTSTSTPPSPATQHSTMSAPVL